jgi:hypothetical protein
MGFLRPRLVLPCPSCVLFRTTEIRTRDAHGIRRKAAFRVSWEILTYISAHGNIARLFSHFRPSQHVTQWENLTLAYLLVAATTAFSET